MLSIRDPIHGFIRIDPLEEALIGSRPMQRLRFIRQLGLTFLIFPGAEHSRFSHVLGTMHLAGRIYDALAERSESQLDPDRRAPERRLVRAAALLHDIGHAPYSHSAEEMFEGGIDHEEMTRRLLHTPELEEIFARHGDGVDAEAVSRVLAKKSEGTERLLSEIVSGELDVDKMDYLLRDSLYCGVRYGSYDLERLIDTVVAIEDPENGHGRIGVSAGGVHALEALVMARYYMFTQVYFNPTGKVMELHYSQYLRDVGKRWPLDPAAFLRCDDVSVLHEMRRSQNRHARAIIERDRYVVAYESREHLTQEESRRFQELEPRLAEKFGEDRLLVDHSAKNPHKLGQARVLVRRFDGSLEPMEEASDFIRHLSKIECFRFYAPRELKNEVAAEILRLWGEDG